MSGRWSPAPPVVATGDTVPPAPGGPKVKVLHVITRLQAGAGGNTLLSSIGMDPSRYEVWIAASSDSPLWERAEQAGVKTVRVPSFRREISPLADLRVLLQLLWLVRRERFAVIHTHSAKGGFLGRLVGVMCRVPVVIYSLHGRDPWWPAATGTDSELDDVMSGRMRAFLFLERLLRLTTHKFVAVSPVVARDAVVARVATAGKMDVAASAVELDAIPCDHDASARRELGIDADVPLVGTVGRLVAQKAPGDFIRMAAIVARTRPDVRFVMVGDGELAEETKALADSLGVDVLFTGYREDAPRLATCFDVFVVTSLYEGVGRSVTEAMASARPVVATAVDGVVDVVAHGATGLLAPARDPQAVAERVCWLLDHPVERTLMGEQAREFVRGLFSPQRMCATLDEIYSELLGLEPLQRVAAADRALVAATR